MTCNKLHYQSNTKQFFHFFVECIGLFIYKDEKGTVEIPALQQNYFKRKKSCRVDFFQKKNLKKASKNILAPISETKNSGFFLEKTVQSLARVPKINFSLTTSKPFHFRSAKIPELKLKKLENIEENSKKKMLSIYESIFELEKSISSPKNFLDESIRLSFCESSSSSKEFFRAVRLNKEIEVLRMLKNNPQLVKIRDSVGKTPFH